MLKIWIFLTNFAFTPLRTAFHNDHMRAGYDRMENKNSNQTNDRISY